jgi:hypothetical protein
MLTKIAGIQESLIFQIFPLWQEYWAISWNTYDLLVLDWCFSNNRYWRVEAFHYCIPTDVLVSIADSILKVQLISWFSRTHSHFPSSLDGEHWPEHFYHLLFYSSGHWLYDCLTDLNIDDGSRRKNHGGWPRQPISYCIDCSSDPMIEIRPDCITVRRSFCFPKAVALFWRELWYQSAAKCKCLCSLYLVFLSLAEAL